MRTWKQIMDSPSVVRSSPIPPISKQKELLGAGGLRQDVRALLELGLTDNPKPSKFSAGALGAMGKPRF